MIGTELWPKPLADLEPVEPRQHDVEHDEVDGMLVEVPERLVAVACLDHAVPVPLEGKGQELLDQFLVVDEENGRGVRHESAHETY